MGWGTKKYVAVSVLAAAAAVYHAFATREQFFPAMVYLSSSKFSIAVLGNLGFALALSVYKAITTVFLGQLRDSELERINDKISQAVLETCLAMTIFRTDFTVSVVTMFVLLSFVKIFHWLVQDRVDFIETTPNVSRLQHARIVAFMGFLLAVDSLFLQFTLGRTLVKGVSVHLLFAFEFAIQASTIVMTFVKYVLSMVDLAMEGRWEGKGVAVFYLELTLDLLHLCVYAAFFTVVFSHYGVPLYLVRDLWYTFRSFTNRLRDFLRYRRITANMDQRFPDATEEDLARADHVCIICREELSAAGRNKKLSCNHVFHLHCLRSWLERQQSCPICRTSVLPPGEAHTHHRHPAAAAGAAPGAAPAAPDAAGAAGAAAPAAGQAVGAAPGAAGDAADAAARGAGLPAGWRFVGGEEQPAAQHPHRRRGYRAYTFQAGGAPHPHAAMGPAGAAPGAAGMGMGVGVGMAAPGMAAFGGGVYDPHQAMLPGLAAGGGQVAGYVVNQWVPATSMALFVPAGGLPLQYAGQQTPADVAAAAAAAAAGQAQLPGIVPILPIMMPPILPPTLAGGLPGMPGAAGMPADAAQQAAAAAAAAAAAVAMVAPHAPILTPQAAPMPASSQALQQMLQQQMDALSAQLAALRQHDASAAAAAAAQAGASGAAAPAAAPAAPAAQPAEDQQQQQQQSKAAEAVSSAAASAAASAAPSAPEQQQQEQKEESKPAEPAAPAAPAEPAEPEGADGSEAAELRRRRLQRFQAGEQGPASQE